MIFCAFLIYMGGVFGADKAGAGFTATTFWPWYLGKWLGERAIRERRP